MWANTASVNIVMQRVNVLYLIIIQVSSNHETKNRY